MRALTLAGFLESYVRYLAGADSLALPRLANQAVSEPRLVEPLLLWSVVTGRARRLSKFMQARDDLRAELDVLARMHEAGSLFDALDHEDASLRPEFHKVWRSYVVQRDSWARDADIKLEARSLILELERQKRVTRYRMAKDLGLNPGNLFAFLKQANPAKLSLERVVRLVEYLEAA